MYFLKNDMKKLSLHHMLIVFDSKSSLTHYIFVLLYLIFYFSKFMFKS